MIIRPFDANLLLTLTILLQTQSVSRTAKRLGLSQPKVSRALAELRQMLADPLLVRSGGRMTLTQRGVELAAPLEKWMAATSTLLKPANFVPAELGRGFRIAATDYGMLSVISPVLPDITDAAPNCRLDVSGYSEEMFKKLASGEIDLIIYGFKPDMAVTHARHLFSETQSLIVRKNHPLASHRSHPIGLDDYLA